MEERFICRPANHVIKEITKRGNMTKRKDPDTGEVVKRTNEYGPNSMFGWGAVDATIPTLKKDLEDLRKDLPAIINQIRPHQKARTVINLDDDDDVLSVGDEIDELFEVAPKRRRPKSDYNKEVHFERRVQQRVEAGPSGGIVTRPLYTSSLLKWWYDSWAKEHEIGNIGKVPEGFTGTKCPSLEEVQQSATGKVLGHFCGFIKGLF